MMTTGIIDDRNMEKQIDKNMRGCMSGFFNIFDRNHVLSGRRLYPKRLPHSVASESPSGSVSSVGSPAVSREFERPKPQELAKSASSPDHLTTLAPATPPRATAPDALTKSPAAVLSFESKDGIKSPWKFTRETPRLSLDSRLHPRGIRTSSVAAGEVRRDGSIGSACDDESERQRRSPSVVARLMGLERLPSSESGGSDLPEKKVELRRSASESRSRDLLHCRFTDGNIFPANLQYQSTSGFATPNARENSNGGRNFSSSNNNDNFSVNGRMNGSAFDRDYASWSANPEPALKPRRMITQQQLRKGLYGFGDFFPEPKPAVSSIYDDIEKRLKVRGIDEPSKDLETLKHILEALQLKGLLHHSNPPTAPASQIGRRNFVYEQRFPFEESPIVVMKPTRSPRTAPRRNLAVTGVDSFSSLSPRREREEIPRTTRSSLRNQTPTSPGRNENRSTSPAATRRKTTVNLEPQRKVKETTTMEPRRVSPVRSPRMGNRRMDPTASQPPRRRKPTVEIRSGRAEDESSTVSESSFSTSSHTDTERSKMEESYKDGKNLLERCDKLLHSIAEMTSATTELQPSPVSVLDSSFYKEESSPSPVMKRTIDFKDQEDEIWSPSSSAEAFMLKSSDTEDNADDHQDPEFAYVSEIIRASNCLPDDSDVFLLLEKQQSIKGRDASKSSRLQRRLIFDIIIEILDRNRQLPPWKSAFSGPSSREVWSELQRIQKRGEESEDLSEVICGVMKLDLTRDSINGWGECQFEISEAVLDIERLIFKDLIGETIGDLAIFSGPRRKLVF